MNINLDNVCSILPHCNYHINIPLRDLEEYFVMHWNEDPYTMNLNPEFQRGMCGKRNNRYPLWNTS